MRSFRRFLAHSTILILLMAVFGTAALAQEGSARVRFMHGIPSASAIDIYTDDQLTISGLDFGQASSYLNIPAGNHNLTVTPAGLTTTLWEQNIIAEAGAAQTLVAATDPLGFLSYRDDLNPLALGNTRLLVVHAIPNGPVIDVMLASGERFIENLQPGQPFGPFDVPANVYDLAITATGETMENALIPLESYKLNGGTSYLLVIYGTAASPTAALLPAAATATAPRGFVRLVHAVPGAPPVDVYMNDTLIAPALTFESITEHLALPVGAYGVSVRDGSTELISANMNVRENGAGTVVVVGTPENITFALFPDNISQVSANEAVISVINTIPGDSSVSARLEDGTVLADGVLSGKSGDVVRVSPGNKIPTIDVTVDGQSETVALDGQTFYGGVYYNAIAFGGTGVTSPNVIFAPTSLEQGITSATDTVTTAQDTATEAPPQPTVVAQQPTAPPPVVTQPPAATQAPTQPTGRVLVNPDANLQLRQYPSADALSLGGAPSGTMLLVNGREGEPVFPEGVTPDPELPEFVDPATLLADEKEDLDPQETWLNVVYNTPDGGSITAWVNAFYLEVRNPKGELQRLADLPMVPNNQPGVARNTAITPPPVPEDRVTVKIFNLNPGVKLNIRRTPETAGERLEGIGNDTVAEFLGLGESGDWVYVRYAPTAGGVITGWVSALYVEYYYNDRKVDLVELEQRGLLTVINDDMETFEDRYRGEVSAGASTAPLPTKDPTKDAYVAVPNINPDANLNLRRTPDVNAEVIGKIPANTQLIITARTANGDWLETSFEGQVGWTATEFVTVTFNGQSVDVLEIPLAANQESNSG